MLQKKCYEETYKGVIGHMGHYLYKGGSNLLHIMSFMSLWGMEVLEIGFIGGKKSCFKNWR